MLLHLEEARVRCNDTTTHGHTNDTAAHLSGHPLLPTWVSIAEDENRTIPLLVLDHGVLGPSLAPISVQIGPNFGLRFELTLNLVSTGNF